MSRGRVVVDELGIQQGAQCSGQICAGSVSASPEEAAWNGGFDVAEAADQMNVLTRRSGVPPTRPAHTHTNEWDGLHTRHLLESLCGGVIIMDDQI